MRIDRHYVPKARSSVLAVEVAGEQVLYDERTGHLHGLNGTAALIWSCCDGTTTLGELVDELADAYGAGTRQVRTGVYSVIRRLADEGLLAASDDVSDDDPPPRPSPADLGPACAPCLAKLDGLGWVGSIGVRLGDLETGVRATSEEALELARGVLAAHVVEDLGATAHYSMVLADAGSSRGPRELNRLYFGHHVVARTRSRARVLRALLSHLDGHLDPTRADGLIVGARALVEDGRAVVVTPEFSGAVQEAEPRLRRMGIAVHDAPSLRLDGVGTVVLTEPTLTVDTAVLAALEADEQNSGELEQPRAGSRRLCGWLVPSGTTEVATVDGPDAIGALVGTVRNLQAFGARSALDVLAGHVAGIPVRSVPSERADALLAEVAALLERG